MRVPEHLRNILRDRTDNERDITSLTGAEGVPADRRQRHAIRHCRHNSPLFAPALDSFPVALPDGAEFIIDSGYKSKLVCDAGAARGFDDHTYASSAPLACQTRFQEA